MREEGDKGLILIVDDEKSMCELLSVVLEKEGYTVDTATNGEAALKLFEKGQYDLVLEDLKMPGRAVAEDEGDRLAGGGDGDDGVFVVGDGS